MGLAEPDQAGALGMAGIAGFEGHRAHGVARAAGRSDGGTSGRNLQ